MYGGINEAGGQQYDKTGLVQIQKTATDAVNAHTQALIRQQQVMQQAVTLHNLLNAAVLAGTKGIANQTAGVGAQIAGILQIVGAQRAYAEVMAVVEAAQGFADLEAPDFWGAAQAFASSAMFAKVSLTSSPGGAGAGGGGRQPSPRYSSGGGSGGVESQGEGGVSTALATGQRSAPNGNVTVAVMGKEDAADWVANILTEGVTQRGVQLVSTISQRGAPVGH